MQQYIVVLESIPFVVVIPSFSFLIKTMKVRYDYRHTGIQVGL